MKFLETVAYNGDTIAISAERILAITPCDPGRTSIIVQDPSPDGTTFIVGEPYPTIRAKLEAL